MAMFTEFVANELFRARAEHRPLNSAHEAYAVILEGLDEFWEQCRQHNSCRCRDAMLVELVRVAAMAQRAAEDLGLVKKQV